MITEDPAFGATIPITWIHFLDLVVLAIHTETNKSIEPAYLQHQPATYKDYQPLLGPPNNDDTICQILLNPVAATFLS